MEGRKASLCSHLKGVAGYLPGIHLFEESVQMIRSVKDVAQRTDCMRNRSEDVTKETTQHNCVLTVHGEAMERHDT